MLVEIKIISRSSTCVAGKPEIPQRVQVACIIERRGQRESVTKHLYYVSGKYVGRGRGQGFIAFPLGILSGRWQAMEAAA